MFQDIRADILHSSREINYKVHQTNLKLFWNQLIKKQKTIQTIDVTKHKCSIKQTSSYLSLPFLFPLPFLLLFLLFHLFFYSYPLFTYSSLSPFILPSPFFYSTLLSFPFLSTTPPSLSRTFSLSLYLHLSLLSSLLFFLLTLSTFSSSGPRIHRLDFL